MQEKKRLVAKSTETLPTGRDTKVIAWQKLSSRQEIGITNLGGYCGEVLHDCDKSAMHVPHHIALQTVNGVSPHRIYST